MDAGPDLILEIGFRAEVIEWRGPAPYAFVAIPEHFTAEVSYAARQASYGWGVVPVEAQIGGVEFRTSLFPRDGGYLLPLKVSVRKQAGLGVGDPLTIGMRIMARA